MIQMSRTVTIVAKAHNLVVGAQPRLEDEALWSAGRLLLTVAAAIIMSRSRASSFTENLHRPCGAIHRHTLAGLKRGNKTGNPHNGG